MLSESKISSRWFMSGGGPHSTKSSGDAFVVGSGAWSESSSSSWFCAARDCSDRRAVAWRPDAEELLVAWACRVPPRPPSRLRLPAVLGGAALVLGLDCRAAAAAAAACVGDAAGEWLVGEAPPVDGRAASEALITEDRNDEDAWGPERHQGRAECEQKDDACTATETESTQPPRDTTQ